MEPSVTILADLRHDQSTTPEGADGAVVAPGAPAPGGLHVLVMSEPAHTALPCHALLLGMGDITNRELVEAAALAGKPLMADTTGATLKEVARVCGWHQLAFRARHPAPGGRLCLLHGVAGVAPLTLRALRAMHEHTFASVGLIDGTEGSAGELAVALGAHILLRANGDIREYARRIRRAEALLGARRKEPDGAELVQVMAVRSRIVAARDIAKGQTLSPPDLVLTRPGPAPGELAPHQSEVVLGRPAARDIKAGQPIRVEDLAGEAPGEAQWFAPRPPSHKPGTA